MALARLIGQLARAAFPLFFVGVLSSFASGARCAQVEFKELDSPAAIRIRKNREEVRANRLPVTKRGGIVYSTDEDYSLTLDVYRPTDEMVYPGVLLIHGGAWAWGSKLHWLRHARRLASHGFVVVAINYRLAPKYKFPAQLDDTRSALRWINENAQTYRIDTEHIGAYGYSAGAHLALLLATCPDDSKNEFTKVTCVAAGGAPADFDWIDENSNALAYWLGGPRRRRPEVYLRASPRSNLDQSDDCAFFFYHAANDEVVPIASAKRFAEQARALNKVVKFVELPNKGHFLAFLQTDVVDEVADFMKATFRK